MGRLLLILLFVVTIVLLWKAFAPPSLGGAGRSSAPQPRQIKGPDDDEEFLWQLEKERFKQRRAEEERRKRQEKGEH